MKNTAATAVENAAQIVIAGAAVQAQNRRVNSKLRERMDEYRRQNADKPASKSSFVFFLLFGLFWCGIVGAFDCFMIPAFIRQAQSGYYRPAPARIVKSEVKRHHDSDGSSYNVDFAYQYIVNDSEYTGTRYKFDKSSSSDGQWARDAVAAYPAGADRICYYDPGDPSRAVLSKGLHGGDVFTLMFMTPFNLVALGFIGYPIYAWRERQRPLIAEPREKDRFGNRESFSMNASSPGFTFLGAFFLTTFLATFVVVIPSGFHPSMAKVCTVWGIGLIISLGTAAKVYFATKAGRYDLVVDHSAKTVTIPAMHRRRTAEIVPIAKIQSIAAMKTETGSGEDAKTEWHVKLRTRDDTEFLLQTAFTEKDAERLTATLNERIRG